MPIAAPPASLGTPPTRPAAERRHWNRTARIALAAAPAVLVLIVGIAAFDGVRRARESRIQVDRARGVIERARVTLSAMQDAETGQRGYLLSSDTSYLVPYYQARLAIASDTAALRTLTRDNPRQQSDLDTLTSAIAAKMDELARTIALHRAGRANEARLTLRAGNGVAAMSDVRRLLAGIIANENALLSGHEANEAHRDHLVSLILIVGTSVAVVFGLLLNGSLVRSNNVQAALVRDLEVQNTQLQEQGLELELLAEQLEGQATELELQNAALKSATAGAENANRAKGDFLATMSHELRTPLNAIAGYVQLMQLGIPEPVSPANRDYLARIQQSQRYLLGLVNSVLNFARIEAGSLHYDVRDVQVDEILASVEPLIVPQMQRAGHKFVRVPAPPTLVVEADPEKVVQILLNLLSNAIKFTPSGGKITLSAAAPMAPDAQSVGTPNMATLRVSDTGIGVPADRHERIFDPFVQIDSSRSRTAEGTGLGLAISRDLARGMGGDITVDSRIGTGSTFIVTLPLAGGAARKTPEPDSDESSVAKFSKL